ncbi:MAG TPA: phosphate signaling complex protein PhoU [Vicinamibacterales bacterium]|nr:phosphate signaling complex protein PhoU [Vicinamibacterales bacterium]
MQRHFHEELRTLEDRLAEMGALVEARTRDAITALREQRPDLAAAVASGDGPVNDLELVIDDLCLRVLALQHPVGSDLRTVRSILKANTDLERVGDQAVNIAQAAMKLVQLPTIEPARDIDPLANLALAMLHDTLQAFVERDVDRALSVLRRDDAADATRDAILRARLSRMSVDPGTAERGVALILIARCLERIADHATNIAEDLIFLVEGRDIRHQGQT